jgi:hypothetical protein
MRPTAWAWPPIYNSHSIYNVSHDAGQIKHCLSTLTLSSSQG